MTTGVAGTGLRAGLLERLFTRGDADKSQSINSDELAALISGDDAPSRASSLIKAHDSDGDGQLTMSELSGATLAPGILSTLLTIQEYADADRAGRAADDSAAIDDFFARADSDGNGELSKDEFDAERILRMAEAVDAGATVPQHLFAVMPEALADEKITRDELMIARRLADVAEPIAMDDPRFDPELIARLKGFQEARGEPQTPPEPRPDAATTISNAVRSADLTQTLIARLIKQLEIAIPTAPTQDLTA